MAFPWGWFWLAMGIAVAAALTTWALTRRVRSGTPSWQARIFDAYAKGTALHDAMAAAQTPGAIGAGDAALRWADIQRRADDYGALLFRMGQRAPGDHERLAVAGVITSLQAARSAMDAERWTRGVDSSLAVTVHDRLDYFAAALRSLRQPDVEPA